MFDGCRGEYPALSAVVSTTSPLVPFIGDKRAFMGVADWHTAVRISCTIPELFYTSPQSPGNIIFSDIPVAQGKGVVEPNTVANNFGCVAKTR